MDEQRFDVRFHPEAFKEYQKLDNSSALLVDKALEELEVRADEVGKNLGNLKDTKLAGCKEIKFRSAGIRIIFRITDEFVDVLRIVIILAIERRSKDMVFKLAHDRLNKIKEIPESKLAESIEKAKKRHRDNREK